MEWQTSTIRVILFILRERERRIEREREIKREEEAGAVADSYIRHTETDGASC